MEDVISELEVKLFELLISRSLTALRLRAFKLWQLQGLSGRYPLMSDSNLCNLPDNSQPVAVINLRKLPLFFKHSVNSYL
ncbi:hypothetical protein J6590_101648 [Homalodisca vitripennis]|nr:hypothetical protein J6590_101648 [Homalodisca vitripennis]